MELKGGIVTVNYQPKQTQGHLQRKKDKERGVFRWLLVLRQLT